MKLELSACIIGLCTLSTGCNIAQLATQNLCYETTLCCDDLRECIRCRYLADSAWREIQKANGGHTYSADYARGFKAGFVDSLSADGTGAPPSVPPPRYWKPRYQTSEGQQAIDDWYAGFQHGVAVAQASDGVLVQPSETTGTIAPSNP